MSDRPVNGAGSFAALAKCVAATNDLFSAAVFAENNPACENRQRTILKTAVSAGSMNPDAWGSQLSEYNQTVQGFLDSLKLKDFLEFSKSLQGPVKLLLNSRLFSSTGFVGFPVAEGTAKPVGTLSFDSTILEPRKAVSIVVLTTAIVRGAGNSGQSFITRQMQNGIAAATNEMVFAELANLAASIPSAGPTAANVLADIGNALQGIDSGDDSVFVGVVNSSTAKALATITTTDGLQAFPDFSPSRGGSLATIPFLISDKLPDAGTMLIADASALVVDSDGTVILDKANSAAIQLDDNPVDDGATLVSLFANNLTALRVERRFGFAVARDNAVAVVTNVHYNANVTE